MSIELFTRKQAAEILGLSPVSLWRMEKRGTLIPVFYINGRPRYSAKALEKATTQKLELTESKKPR